MPRRLALPFVLAVTACGSSSSERRGDDIDAAPPSADASLDAAPPPLVFDPVCGGGLAAPGAPALWYVVDALTVPGSNAQATAAAMDVDGDGSAENALGNLLATLAGFDLDTQPPTDDAIAEGRHLQLVGVATETPVDSGAVSAVVRVGADRDDDAADNFSGAEAFDVVPVPDAHGTLPGQLTGGVLCAGLAPAPILFTLFPGHAPIAVPFFAAKVEATRGEGGLTGGKLGGGVGRNAIDDIFIPELSAGISEVVARDCPDMTCEPDTEGEQLRTLFDADDDYVVTIEELLASDLIDGTLRNPDLDLLAGDAPGQDGIKDALSLGLSFSAVPAGAP